MSCKKEIIELCIKGDESAYKELYKAYYKKIYFFCLKNLKTEEEALDALQDVFLDVFKYINKLQNNEKFNSWIYKIAVNRCKKIAMKKNKIFFIEEYNDRSNILINCDESANPEKYNENSEIAKILSQAIDSLSEKKKIVILLYYYNGLKISEISEIINIPMGTVKTRLKSGKEELKKIMQSNKTDSTIYSPGWITMFFFRYISLFKVKYNEGIYILKMRMNSNYINFNRYSWRRLIISTTLFTLMIGISIGYTWRLYLKKNIVGRNEGGVVRSYININKSESVIEEVDGIRININDTAREDIEYSGDSTKKINPYIDLDRGVTKDILSMENLEGLKYEEEVSIGLEESIPIDGRINMPPIFIGLEKRKFIGLNCDFNMQLAKSEITAFDIESGQYLDYTIEGCEDVKTNVPGEYVLTYKTIDAEGLSTELERIIVVMGKLEVGSIICGIDNITIGIDQVDDFDFFEGVTVNDDSGNLTIEDILITGEIEKPQIGEFTESIIKYTIIDLFGETRTVERVITVTNNLNDMIDNAKF